MAIIIHQRINEIRSVESIEQLIQYSIDRCHRLKGKRKTQYAMDLVNPYRIIIANDEVYTNCAKILAIEDYH